MHPTVVINVVGLTQRMIGPDTPVLQRLAAVGATREIGSVVPAVTCPVQTTYLTGLLPRDHGIVGNGWYFRDLSEVMFWRQSNRLGCDQNANNLCANIFLQYVPICAAAALSRGRPQDP